jgi:hypothetical protein
MTKRGFRPAAFCLPALVLLAALAASLSAPAPGWAAADIWIKTGNAWSVTGQDDLQQLKYLASGVGWEFGPNADTTAALKRVGIQTIRCINVDVDGGFDAAGNYVVKSGNSRLEAHLDECRALGAVPHIIIAQGVPQELLVKPEDVTDPALKKLVSEGSYGPTDWTKFRSYIEAYFQYVLITKGFTNAEFEVANEPDICGGIYPFPPKPTVNGAAALYDAAFNLYKNCAEAAVSFEQHHPGVKVKLGGMALAGFTFSAWGDFNWTIRFLHDCNAQKVKVDFIGMHYYGNNSSLDGGYPGFLPPFTKMIRITQAAIDQFCPHLPIQVTEWGPSYVTDTSDSAAVNANNVGAAYGAAFLNTALGCGVSKLLYLVTTDLWEWPKDAPRVDVWGWPSLFLMPPMYGDKAYPKPIYHLFEMVSRLEGHRVEATRGSDTVNCFASADPTQRKLTMLIWNYGDHLGNGDATAPVEATQIHVRDAGSFFHGQKIQAETWQINENTDNIYKLLTTGVPPDANNTAMAQLPTTTAKIVQGVLEVPMVVPPSTVSLVVLTEAP